MATHNETAEVKKTPWFWPGRWVWRLIAIACVAVVLAGVVGARITAQAIHEQALQRLVTQQNDEVELVARLLASKIEQSQKVLSTVASGITPDVLASDGNLEWLLRDGLPAMHFFDAMQVVSANGEVSLSIQNGRIENASAVKPSARDYLRRTLAAGKPLVSELIAEPDDEARVLFTMPLRQGDGTVIGAVAGSLKLSSQGLLPPSMALPARADSRLVVFTREGRIISNSEPDRGLADVKDEPGLAAVYSRWQEQDTALLARARSYQLPGFVVSLAGVPLPQWVVARVSHTQAWLAPLQGAQRNSWWWVAAAVGGIALVMVVLLLWSAQPLALLRRKALQLVFPPEKNGYADAAVSWPQSPGEIDTLVDIYMVLEQQHQQESRAHAALQSQLRGILNSASEGIVVTHQEKLVLVGQQASRMLGYSVQELQGQSVRVVCSSEEGFRDFALRVSKEFAAHGTFDGEACFARKDGSVLWARMQARMLQPDSWDAGAVWTFQDITKERASRKKADWQQEHDPLTQLPLRAQFEEALENLLEQRVAERGGQDVTASRQTGDIELLPPESTLADGDLHDQTIKPQKSQDKPLQTTLFEAGERNTKPPAMLGFLSAAAPAQDGAPALDVADPFAEAALVNLPAGPMLPVPADGAVLFMDLDHFTVINDEAGHRSGDDALCFVARLIETEIGQEGWVARMGGDEFGVLLPEATSARALAVAEQLRAAVQAWEPAYAGRSFTLGLSVGLVMLDRPHLGVSAMVHAADMACYDAKRAGRNQVRRRQALPLQESMANEISA